VKTDEDRLRAATIARDVEGVNGVINELDVDPTAIDDPPLGNSGATLETAVAAELRRDPVLGSRDIRMVADRRSNSVTLIGQVASQAERQRATRIAEDGGQRISAMRPMTTSNPIKKIMPAVVPRNFNMTAPPCY